VAEQGRLVALKIKRRYPPKSCCHNLKICNNCSNKQPVFYLTFFCNSFFLNSPFLIFHFFFRTSTKGAKRYATKHNDDGEQQQKGVNNTRSAVLHKGFG
jgi:hypothetical protein